jgi:hypothetical protein
MPAIPAIGSALRGDDVGGDDSGGDDDPHPVSTSAHSIAIATGQARR